jgi:phosphoribosylformylglycinamidine cyclo-ligase
MKRSDVIDNARIQAGDVIVGLASFGQASYEKLITAVWAATA